MIKKKKKPPHLVNKTYQCYLSSLSRSWSTTRKTLIRIFSLLVRKVYLSCSANKSNETPMLMNDLKLMDLFTLDYCSLTLVDDDLCLGAHWDFSSLQVRSSRHQWVMMRGMLFPYLCCATHPELAGKWATRAKSGRWHNADAVTSFAMSGRVECRVRPTAPELLQKQQFIVETFLPRVLK